jgi:hypothetical protein
VPAIDFTDLASVLELVTRRARFANADEAETLLEESAGRDASDAKIYRPYVVLAVLFATQWNAYTRLVGASGAELEYADPDDAVRDYRRQQARFDESLEIVEIPSAWPALVTDTFRSSW